MDLKKFDHAVAQQKKAQNVTQEEELLPLEKEKKSIIPWIVLGAVAVAVAVVVGVMLL